MDEGTAPSLGNGRNPYQIDNLSQLKWLSFNQSIWTQNKHFIQTSDINATETKNWANGYGFSPIGNGSIWFEGVYDGQNYSIINLHIESTHPR